MTDDADEPPDHDIGYGKPPRASRFKPGLSGNPSGRPKLKGSLRDEMNKVLSTLISYKKDGKQKHGSALVVVLENLLRRSAMGDHKATLSMIKMIKDFGLISPEKVAPKDYDTTDWGAVARRKIEEIAKRLREQHPERFKHETDGSGEE